MPFPVVSAEEFLRAIWGEGPGVSELTVIGPKGVKSFPFNYPDSLTSLLAAATNHNKDSNAYMGVCLRKEPWPRKTGRMDSKGKEIIEFRGTEGNALSSMCAAWCEIDFKGAGHKGATIEEAEARKRLMEFPLKPSIIQLSGGGIQIFWLGKEPIEGNDLWRLKAVNKAVATCLGADKQSVDLARILRIPGTMNLKYSPPRQVQITWLRLENRYTLDDFDFLPVESPETPSPQAGPTTASSESTTVPIGPSASSKPNPAPKVDLNEEQIAKIGDLFGEIWIPGLMHKMAMCVAGMLVNRGVKLESTRQIVARASNKVGGETEKRLKDAADTYEKWYRNEKVTGATELEAFIREHTPAAFTDKAISILEKVKKVLPKNPSGPPSGNGGGEGNQEPDFKIVKIINFDSRPARWQVTLEFTDGQQHTATVETTSYMRYHLFQDSFVEQTQRILMDLKNTTWKAMLAAYGPAEQQKTPKEARPEGAIESALDEFLSEAKQNAEIGVLNAFAGFNDTCQYFRFKALDNFIKNANLKIEHRVIYEYLNNHKFENDTMRFGPKTVNVWRKKIVDSEEGGTNGNGKGNGHPPPPPKPPRTPADLGLFSTPEDPIPVPEGSPDSSPNQGEPGELG